MLKNSLQKFIKKIDKFIVLSLASIVFVVFLVVLAIGVKNECNKAKNTVVDYLKAKTKQEQLAYLNDNKKVIVEVEDDIFSVSDLVFNIGKSEGLDLEDKKEFLFVLRRVEESADTLEKGFSAYFNDMSIQYSPFSDNKITSYIYESKNFSLASKRFVRQAEFVLLGSSETTLQQGELLAEQYYEVVWYVNELATRF